MIKHLIAFFITVILFSPLCGFADDLIANGKNKGKIETLKTTPVRATVINVTGKVTEVSDTTIIIERTIKDKVEFMEFALEKPAKVKVGDKVRISYMEKEGKNTAVKLYRVIKKKAPPKDLKIGEQPVTPPVIAPTGK